MSAGFTSRCRPFLAALVLLGAFFGTHARIAGAQAVAASTGGVVAGFQIDADLEADAGFTDWFTGDGGAGTGLIYRKTDATPCAPVDATKTRFVRDPSWAQGDNDITVFGKTSDKNNACIVVGAEPWNFKSGSGPQKNDITEAYATIVTDDDPFSPTFGHTFFIAAAAHRETNGDNHFDFELNQRGLVDIFDAGSTTQGITVGGPGTENTCGRSILDQIISVDFGNGGTNPVVSRREWKLVGGVYQYVDAPVAGAYAAINSGPVDAPCDATQPAPSYQLGPQYQKNQFIEIAIDLTASGVPDEVLCKSTTTLSIKTRSSGEFTAELKDRVTFPFTVLSPPPCAITGPTDVCRGQAFELCAPSGNGFTYVWGGAGIPSGESTAPCIHPTGLAAGTHTFTLTVNNGGCSNTCSVVVTVREVSLALTKTDVKCNGGSDGTITATFLGGTGPYTLSLDGGGFQSATSPATLTGLAAGSHTVVVRDAQGCEKSATITIGQPPALTLVLTPTHVTCNGAADGKISATFGGGTAPYTCSIDGGAFGSCSSAASYTSLAAGSHTITIRDANGCEISRSVTIDEPPALTLTLTPTGVGCTGASDGKIVATFGGGTAPYQCSIDNGPFGSCASPAEYTGLAAGSHSITIKDANGCTITRSVNVDQPAALTLELAPTAATCFGVADGRIVATFGGGTGPYTCKLGNGSPSTCTSPATYNGLAAGQYTLLITDANDCTISKTVTVGQPTQVTLSLTPTHITCNGAADGKIAATFDGGTGPYTCSIDGGAFASCTPPANYTNLGPGTHTVKIRDANGCEATRTVTINEPPALTLTLSKTDGVCGGGAGSIAATFGGGTSPYQISIDGGAFAAATSPKTFANLATGAHSITVKDANGCTITRSETVTTQSCGQLAPTQVSCEDYTSGGAPDLTGLCYGVKGGKINNVAPGVFFYYSKVIAPSASFTVTVEQTNDRTGFPLFQIQQGQAFLYNASCGRLLIGSESSRGQATFNVTGATVGQLFIVGIKYEANSVVGARLNGSSPDVNYDFRTKVGGNVVDQDTDGLTLSNCVGGTTVKTDALDAAMGLPGDEAAWSLELYRPTPNPFTGTLQMAYEVQDDQAPVHVRVFDLAGRHVRTLERGTLSTGRYRVTWDGRDDHGMAVRHGVFFVHAQVGDRTRVVRVLHLK